MAQASDTPFTETSEVLSESWQKKFALIEKAGGPKLPNGRLLSFSERMKLMSVLAFLFGPVYYLIKGMGKKALTLTLLSIAIYVVIKVVFNGNALANVANFVGAAIFGGRAVIDYYKKVKLGDNGWW